MKYSHFDAFQPVCPVCKNVESEIQHPLTIGSRLREDPTSLFEGILNCTNPVCQHEYPVIDGIPIIVADLRNFVTSSQSSVLSRDDLDQDLETLLGDCLGTGSPFDVTRQQLSSYAWSHYGDKDNSCDHADGGNLVQLMEAALSAVPGSITGPSVDLGCGVGRSTFELAELTRELVLGLDLNYAMLRLASHLLNTGVVRYPRRRGGLVYDRSEFPVNFANASLVDFWACDVTAIPLPNRSFSTALSLNLLDAVSSPYQHLMGIASLLRPNGTAMIACPFDWSAAVTPEASWIGGHSQRSEERGTSHEIVKRLLAQPPLCEHLQVVGERDNIPWKVRLHDRSIMHYDCHVLVLEFTD